MLEALICFSIKPGAKKCYLSNFSLIFVDDFDFLISPKTAKKEPILLQVNFKKCSKVAFIENQILVLYNICKFHA